MRLCRFDTDRLGVLRGDMVVDVTSALDSIPAARWPIEPGDLLIANLDRLRGMIEHLANQGTPRHLADCALKSPVANPSTILGVPKNYYQPAHDLSDEGLGPVSTLEQTGMFVKATSALIGPSEGIELLPGRQHDHEVELAAVIGSWCRNVSRERALDHVAGYTVALDMTIKGTEDRSLRKSADGHAVLGPWLITRDEVAEPGNLGLWLQVNRQPRQRGNTRHLINDLPRLIEYASSFCTLYPGDIILTGTPTGIGPVASGDVVDAGIAGIGSMRVEVR
jgi:2,4-diketo-3-deoxy-L-fuconate hydrolase